MTDARLAAGRPLPPRVQAYVDAIVQRAVEDGLTLVSVILFGSVVTGGFSEGVSDVDLLLVVSDVTSQGDRLRLRAHVDRLEIAHGFRDHADRPVGLEALARRITANVRSFFICTRDDFLSGDVARLLGIPRAQAVFVDRVVIPSIVGSAITVWGDDLLPRVPLPPIRRLDVAKAFWGIFNQLLLSAAMYPVVPSATSFAMGALKRSVHNCYFCYHLRPAPLEEEIAFFLGRPGPRRTLTQLMALRRAPRPSLAFVVRCLPTLAWLHWRTAVDNRFPLECR